MDIYPSLAANCQATIEGLAMTVDAVAEPLAAAVDLITGALLGERKVLTCGSGADATLAQLFVVQMQSQFQQERPALPAMTLSADGATLAAIAGHSGQSELYARQLRALGQPGDVLLCIASGDADPSVLQAIDAAHERSMSVVALSKAQDNMLQTTLAASDVQIAVNVAIPARALELHTVIIQNLCELIDSTIFGSYTGTPS